MNAPLASNHDDAAGGKWGQSPDVQIDDLGLHNDVVQYKTGPVCSLLVGPISKDNNINREQWLELG